MYKKANKSAGKSRDEEKLKTVAKDEPIEGDRKDPAASSFVSNFRGNLG